MHIKNKYLRTSINDVVPSIKIQEVAKSKKNNISTEAKDRGILNFKVLPSILEINEYKDMDLFEKHLMLNLW